MITGNPPHGGLPVNYFPHLHIPEIDYNNYADNYFDFYHVLKALFGRDVDLVDETTVKNPYFKEELAETKYLIYG